jgi:Asp-tRNA(Asn)/Glu-tRNA(Gln) amidotransferase A subunit family amidase
MTNVCRDTVGPIVRSIADAAAVLSVIAGKDPLDNFTLAQPDTVPDYTKALNKSALAGARIGVVSLVSPVYELLTSMMNSHVPPSCAQ